MSFKKFLVHFFTGAPCHSGHEVHEYTGLELALIFRSATHKVNQPAGPWAPADLIETAVLPEVELMGLADTKKFWIQDDLVIVHRIR